MTNPTPAMDCAAHYKLTGPRYWVSADVFVQRLDLPGRPWGKFLRKIDDTSDWYVSAFKTRREALNGRAINNPGVAFLPPEDQQPYYRAFVLLAGGGSNSEYIAWNARRRERYGVKYKRLNPTGENEQPSFAEELEADIAKWR